MQKFHLPFSYKTPEKELKHSETWCKKEGEALDRIRVKLPALCSLEEAWLCEWQNPDAPMEQLFGIRKQPNQELKEMLVAIRNSKIGGLISKAKASLTKPRVKLKVPDTVASVEKAVEEYKPFRPYKVLAAVSWRKHTQGE